MKTPPPIIFWRSEMLEMIMPAPHDKRRFLRRYRYSWLVLLQNRKIKVIYCETWKDRDVLPAMEEGLKCKGLAAVVGEVTRFR